MKILHIISPERTMEAEQRFIDLAGALHRLGVQQRLLTPADDTLSALLAARELRAETARFKGLFDLRTQAAVKNLAAEYEPHIIQTHCAVSADLAAKSGFPAVRIGFADGYGAPDRGLRLITGYGASGIGLDIDLFPVPPLVDRAALPTNGKTAKKSGAPFLAGMMIDWMDRYETDRIFGAIKSIPGLRLRIAGRGPEEESYRRQAEQMGVADRVLFTAADGQEWPRLLEDLDLCVVPRRTAGIDRLTVQAWSCGLCVASAMPPGATPITHGVTGWLVEDGGSIRGWRAAFKDLLSDAARRAALAEAGRRAYEDGMTADIAVRRYLQAYETALKVKARLS